MCKGLRLRCALQGHTQEAVIKIHICAAERPHKQPCRQKVLNIRRNIMHPPFFRKNHKYFPQEHKQQIGRRLQALLNVLSHKNRINERRNHNGSENPPIYYFPFFRLVFTVQYTIYISLRIYPSDSFSTHFKIVSNLFL